MFYASAGKVLVIGIVALIFYKEPPRDEAAEQKRSLKEVFAGIVAVVGNGRFFLLVSGMLVLLVMGSKWLAPIEYLPAAGVWLAANLLLDIPLRKRVREGATWSYWC